MCVLYVRSLHGNVRIGNSLVFHAFAALPVVGHLCGLLYVYYSGVVRLICRVEE